MKGGMHSWDKKKKRRIVFFVRNSMEKIVEMQADQYNQTNFIIHWKCHGSPRTIHRSILQLKFRWKYFVAIQVIFRCCYCWWWHAAYAHLPLDLSPSLCATLDSQSWIVMKQKEIFFCKAILLYRIDSISSKWHHVSVLWNRWILISLSLIDAVCVCVLALLKRYLFRCSSEARALDCCSTISTMSFVYGMQSADLFIDMLCL